MAHTTMESDGALILRLSETVVKPFLMKKLHGCQDENDMPVQPAHIRGLALNMAREWVKYYQSTVH